MTYESTVRDYLDTLFCEREKGNYLIYFIRFCIAAYIKEQKDTYQMYIESPIDEWIGKEVEAIDHEADQVQIMACVNYFDIGVKIEYLNKNQSEIVKLPFDKPMNNFLFFYYLLLDITIYYILDIITMLYIINLYINIHFYILLINYFVIINYDR